MLSSTVYIHVRRKLLEDEGWSEKVTEREGNVWKSLENARSVHRYVGTSGQSGPESRTETIRER